MIFKTFDTDIDKISTKWGIFGKSFNDIGNAISGKISDINKNFQATDDLIGSIKNSGDSILQRLYPSKKSIQSQMVDVDALYPDLNDSNFSSILDKLVKNNEQVKSGSITWQKYFSTLGEGEKWQIEFIQNNDLQKASLDDVKKSYDNARQSAIAHNTALKQQTLGAKAATVATKALSVAANMIAFALITKGIELVTNAIDKYVNRAKYAAEAMQEAQQKIDDSQNSLKTMSTTLSENKDRFLELSKGVSEFSKNLHLSEDDYAEYLSISNELAELFPTLISSYDEQGNALLAIGDNADETNEKLQSLLETQQAIAQQTLIDNMDDVAEGIYHEVENAKDSIFAMKQELDSLEEQLNLVNIDIKSSHGSITLNDIDYDKYGKAVEKALTSAGIKFEKFNDGYNSTIELSSASPEQLEQAQKFYDAWLSIENEYYYASKKGLERDIQEKEKAIKNSYSKMTANLQAWVKDNYNYQYLSDSSANIVDILIPQIKWEELKSPPSTAEAYQRYVEDNIIKPLMEIPQENKQEIDDMFSKLLSFEEGDLNVLQFAEQLRRRLNELDIEIDITPIIADEQDAKKRLQNSIESIAKGGSADFYTSSGVRVDANDYKTLEEYTKGFTADQIELWNTVTLGAENAADAINKYEEASKSASSINASFSDAFNSSDFSEHKESLLELAKAGELTEETLSSTEEYKKFLDETGLSTENVKDRIYDVLTAQEKLAGANNGIDNLKSSYEEFKELGFVTAQTLEDLPDVFKSLDGYDLFSQIVGNPESGVEAIQQAFNNIVTEYLMFTQTLNSDSLISDNVEEQQRVIQTYIANLKKMGVTNAEEVVNSAVASAKQQAKQQKELIEKAEKEYINYLETKDENDLKYIESTASYNSQLINSLSDGYTTDYQNWLNLLEDKELAYNRFVNSLTGDNGFNYDPTKNMTDNLLANGKDLSANNIAEAEIAKAEYERIQKKYNELRDSISFKGVKFESNLDLDYDGSDSNSSSKDSTSSFDWIETQISNMEDELDNLDNKVANTYSKWEQRNKDLADSIAKTNEAIKLQENAANAYMNEANSVGISSHYKTLVQKGALNIEDISDKDLAEKISEYQDLYEKSKECTDKANELRQTLNELSSSEKWDLLKSESDADIDILDKRIDAIQTSLDKLDLNGMFANSSYYSDMVDLTQSKIDSLIFQEKELQNILKTMASGTEAYDTMFAELMDIRNQISELENDCIEFNNNIRDLDWEIFEFFEDSISRITEEINFFKDLLSDEDMFDDNGNMTKYADATIGLHYASIETYKKQAQDYYEKMQELQQQLVNGAGQDVLEKYREYEDLHRDMVLAIQDEQKAVLDLVQNGYEEQLKILQEINQATLDRMDAERDLYNFQKDIEQKTQEKTSIERQMDVLRGDDSEEAKSKLQQLEVKLSDVNADIEETLYEQQRNDTQAMLDALESDYQEWYGNRLDNESALLEEIRGEVESKSNDIITTLKEVAGEYGTTLSTSLTDIFSSEKPFDNVVTAINNLIEKITGFVGGDSNSDGGSNSGNNGGSSGGNKPSNTDVKQPSTPTTPSTSTTQNTKQPIDTQSKSEADNIFIPQKSVYPKEKLDKDGSVVDRLKYFDFASDFSSRAIYYRKLGGSGTFTGSSTQNKWLLSKMKEMGYASGTNYAKKGLHWTQENGDEIIIRKSDGAVLTPLNWGDKVVNAEGTNTLFDFANDPQGFLEKFGVMNYTPNLALPKMPNIQPRNTSNEVNLGGVHIAQVVTSDAQDFMRQLPSVIANDTKTQKVISEVVLGGALGRNSMSAKRFL